MALLPNGFQDRLVMTASISLRVIVQVIFYHNRAILSRAISKNPGGGTVNRSASVSLSCNVLLISFFEPCESVFKRSSRAGYVQSEESFAAVAVLSALCHIQSRLVSYEIREFSGVGGKFRAVQPEKVCRVGWREDYIGNLVAQEL